MPPSRLRPRDALRVAAAGLRTRPLRAVLSVLGIAVGIAAMVAVVGISASSRAEIDRQLEALGTNLLTVEPGQTLRSGETAKLPAESVDMVARIGPVTSVSGVGAVEDALVYRTDKIDEAKTNGITTLAARPDLLDTVSGQVASGRWLDEALAAYPTVVLGATTAERLGISQTDGSVAVWLGERGFTAVGILAPAPLAPELDTAALVGWPIAEERLGYDGAPTRLYERSAESQVDDIRAVLAPTVNPANPEEVAVSRPSDALAARAAADETLLALLLALGGVALLVGGIGVANTMVIAVLERRSQIGLRRAPGSPRPDRPGGGVPGPLPRHASRPNVADSRPRHGVNPDNPRRRRRTMADPLRYPETKGPTRRRWLRISVILAVVLILVGIVLLITLGGHDISRQH